MSDEPNLPPDICAALRAPRACVGCGQKKPCEVRLALAPEAPVQFFCTLECLHLHLDGCREALEEEGKAGASVAHVERLNGKTWLLLPGLDLDVAVDEPHRIIHELADLLKAAAARICRTVRIARETGKYKPYSWASESARRQAQRADRHMGNYWAKTSPDYTGPQDTRGAGGEKDAATELDHALTRLAILAAIQDAAARGSTPGGPF